MYSQKSSIKDFMKKNGVNIDALSKKTNISKYELFLLLYCPFLKLKLSHFVLISRGLNIHISDLL